MPGNPAEWLHTPSQHGVFGGSSGDGFGPFSWQVVPFGTLFGKQPPPSGPESAPLSLPDEPDELLEDEELLDEEELLEDEEDDAPDDDDEEPPDEDPPEDEASEEPPDELAAPPPSVGAMIGLPSVPQAAPKTTLPKASASPIATHAG